MREIKEMIIPLSKGKGHYEEVPAIEGIKTCVGVIGTGMPVYEAPRKEWIWDEEPEREGKPIECKFYYKGSDIDGFVEYFHTFVESLVQYDEEKFTPRLVRKVTVKFQ